MENVAVEALTAGVAVPAHRCAPFDRFLAGVQRRAFVMARMAADNDDDALDIVQDAMYVFVRTYGNKPEAEWSPLFRRTLQSRITDWHRRTTLRQRFRVWFGGGDSDEEQDDPLHNRPDPSSPDPLGELMRSGLGEAIQGALRRLPLRQRQAFLLRAWEGLDVAETAQAMGCSTGSVKTHYFRACGALRTMLAEYGP
jgi:RNA polymerase sigma-70 factor (ECF subfamily)